jgi:hypothetical protein
MRLVVRPSRESQDKRGHATQDMRLVARLSSESQDLRGLDIQGHETGCKTLEGKARAREDLTGTQNMRLVARPRKGKLGRERT